MYTSECARYVQVSMVKHLNCVLVLQTSISLAGTIKNTVKYAVLEIQPSYHENAVLLDSHCY